MLLYYTEHILFTDTWEIQIYLRDCKAWFVCKIYWSSLFIRISLRFHWRDWHREQFETSFWFSIKPKLYFSHCVYSRGSCICTVRFINLPARPEPVRSHNLRLYGYLLLVDKILKAQQTPCAYFMGYIVLTVQLAWIFCHCKRLYGKCYTNVHRLWHPGRSAWNLAGVVMTGPDHGTSISKINVIVPVTFSPHWFRGRRSMQLYPIVFRPKHHITAKIQLVPR